MFKQGDERTLRNNEQAYKNMKLAAAMLEVMSEHNAQYIVEDTYLDFGQDWMWTTIVRRGWHDCQILNPREWFMITNAETTEDVARAVDDIRSGEWFRD